MLLWLFLQLIISSPTQGNSARYWALLKALPQMAAW